MRDPVERIISHYRFNSTQPSIFQNAIRERGLDVVGYLTHFGAAIPLQYQLFAPASDAGEEERSAQAVRNLETSVSLFGLQEQFDGFVSMLAALLGLPDVSHKVLNKLPSGAATVTVDQIERLRPLLKHDLAFYEGASKMYRHRTVFIGGRSACLEQSTLGVHSTPNRSTERLIAFGGNARWLQRAKQSSRVTTAVSPGLASFISLASALRSVSAPLRGGLATTIGRGSEHGAAGLAALGGPSVLRRRHSGRLSHRSWLALPVLVMVRRCAWGRGQKPLPFGAARGAIMGNVVYDFLLFSCMALFVTGIVLAAASLLI